MASFMTLPIEIHYFISEQLLTLPASSYKRPNIKCVRHLISALNTPHPSPLKQNLRCLYATPLAIYLKHQVGHGMILAQRQHSKSDRENFRTMWKRTFAGDMLQIDVDIGSDIPWLWAIFFQIWYDTRVRIPCVEGNGWSVDECCDNFGCRGDCDNRGLRPVKAFLAPLVDDGNEVLRPEELEGGMVEIAAGCKMVALTGLLLARRIKRRGLMSEFWDWTMIVVHYDRMLPTDLKTVLLFDKFKKDVLQWVKDNADLLKAM